MNIHDLWWNKSYDSPSALRSKWPQNSAKSVKYFILGFFFLNILYTIVIQKLNSNDN